MDLGIVVVSYNTRELTAQCLASLRQSLERRSLAWHVWVIDNASADGSGAMIRKQFPWATLIASEQNLGFARGTNLGIERMAALEQPPRHVLLLNPDTVISRDALPLMVSFLDQHPEVGAAGASLRYGDGRFQHGAFHFPNLWMALFDFWPVRHRLLDSRLNGRYARHLYEAGEPFPIDHPLGAALMIRWETIEQVGRLDSGYFMYCEEIDWCIRAKRAGWRIYCVPKAQITHLAGQSTGQFRDKMFVALWKSRYRLFARHYGRTYQLLVRVIVRAGLRHLIRGTTRETEEGKLSPQEAERRIMAYHHVMDM